MDIGEEIREGFVRGYMTPGVTRQEALMAFARSCSQVEMSARRIVLDEAVKAASEAFREAIAPWLARLPQAR